MLERVTVGGDVIPHHAGDCGYFVNEPLDPLIATEFENLLLKCNQFSLNNIAAVPDTKCNRIGLIATRKINAGEEILMYYGDMYDRSDRVPMSKIEIGKKKKWFAAKFQNDIKLIHSKDSGLSIPKKIIVKNAAPLPRVKEKKLVDLPSFKRKYNGDSERPLKKRTIDPGDCKNPFQSLVGREPPVGTSATPDNKKYKTMMCKRWEINSCDRGKMCDFSHGRSELRCFFFHVRGYCKKGSECDLIH